MNLRENHESSIMNFIMSHFYYEENKCVNMFVYLIFWRILSTDLIQLLITWSSASSQGNSPPPNKEKIVKKLKVKHHELPYHKSNRVRFFYGYFSKYL